MGAQFHANWRHDGNTINVDLEQTSGETSEQFVRRIISTLTTQLAASPPDNS